MTSIQNLEGLELRKAVAERRGWEDVEYDSLLGGLIGSRGASPQCAWLGASIRSKSETIPPYEQDTPEGWAAMREVWMALVESGASVEVETFAKFVNASAYYGKANGFFVAIGHEAPNLPTAVCRAYLAATEKGGG